MFATGETQSLITISVVDDALDEDDETVVVTLGAPSNATLGATTAHTCTIIDDDTTPTVVNHAVATPSPVTGTTTTLSVLGADDDGEAALIYI